jgi:hypothetical protein
MKLRLYVTVLGAVLAVAGCSSEEDGDETGTGGTGNEGGTGVGATGGEGVGATGGTGVGGTGSGGEGGGGDCYTCAGYLTFCANTDTPEPECETQDTCAGPSTEIFNALADCVCTACEAECVNTCANMEGDGPECGMCQQMAAGADCSAEVTECVNDA